MSFAGMDGDGMPHLLPDSQPGIVNRQGLVLTDAYLERPLINLAGLEIRGRGVSRFTGEVKNEGAIKVTDTTVVYEQTMTNLGCYVSDPSNNYFMDLVIGESGYLVGGEGDNFFILGDLVSASTMNTAWNTSDAALYFLSGLDNQHHLSVTGSDRDGVPAGFVDNFAWGSLSIAEGNALILGDGNPDPGGALYVEVIAGVEPAGTKAANITGNGLNIYYAADLPENTYLAGLSYDLNGGGRLLPVSPYCRGSDLDLDGICDGADNCPGLANPDQLDSDFDGMGDDCDPCPLDGDNDGDGDGFCGDADNCPFLANPLQTDSDLDGAGDGCDICPFDGDDDGDGDTYCANEDNCPLVYNPDQEDGDGDGHGDLCPLADLDRDGDVDGEDLYRFGEYYMYGDLWADIEEDGLVDGDDLEKFGREYGWQRPVF